jgi:hypothetical protein
MCFTVNRLTRFGVEHNLNNSFAVTQVDEYHTAMIAPSMSPAH